MISKYDYFIMEGAHQVMELFMNVLIELDNELEENYEFGEIYNKFGEIYNDRL